MEWASRTTVAWHLTGLMTAALVGWDLMVPAHWSFIDGVNLIFHEAGHVILAQPEWLMLLGGSLMQVTVPLICAVALSGKDRNGALLTLYWAAQSLGNVSVYIRDAPTRSLPLITGDPDTHDWWQLLAGHLEFAAPLADATLCVAWTLLIAAAVALHLPGTFHELLALITGGDQREQKNQET